MKNNKPKWWQWIIFIVAWMFLFPFALLYLPYYLYINIPIWRAVEEQPLYWLTWKDIKRKSSRSTWHVLSELHMSCAMKRGQYECRFRSVEDLDRLEKFLKKKRPRLPYPISPKQAVFFEYRPAYRGGGRRKRFYISDFVRVPSFAT